MKQTRLLVLMVLQLLPEAIPVKADVALTNVEHSDVLDALVRINHYTGDLEAMGAVNEAAALQAHLDQLKPVQFWKEATGVVDSTRVAVGRWMAGGKDYAYVLPGETGKIYVSDTFLGIRDPNEQNYNMQAAHSLEQVSILLHENMHLRGENDAAAYAEQYKWLRLFGMKRDGTMQGLPNGVSGPYVSPVMTTVVDRLKSAGVDLDALDRAIVVPSAMDRWTGTMTLDETPHYDAIAADAPPEMRGLVRAAMPKRGSSWPLRLLVEKVGVAAPKAIVSGVPGKAGRIEIELIPLNKAEKRVRIRQVYSDVPDRDGKKKDVVYLWTGTVLYGKASGSWAATFYNPSSVSTPVYSGSWQLSR